ncbi:LANO_0F06304g1_1 [Lachancea nothofagi CBS 11611]|uniref:LANO_0F06304g1_1 n=1 Tax=Lachancea nothofagi CBS 11611 TaxID=1266666 RepID=A0A1G4K8J4_9SACH|nr:LANO_0F06304g1_1 [Lachancea nothofagi CBS 11611]
MPLFVKRHRDDLLCFPIRYIRFTTFPSSFVRLTLKCFNPDYISPIYRIGNMININDYQQPWSKRTSEDFKRSFYYVKGFIELVFAWHYAFFVSRVTPLALSRYYTMPRKRPRNGCLQVLQGCGTISSFVGGSLAIVMLCKSQNQPCFNKPALIVLTSGLFANGLSQLALAITELESLGLLLIVPQLLCLGSAIWYVKHLLECLPNSKLSSLELHLAIAHLGLLLTAMLVSTFPLSLGCAKKDEQEGEAAIMDMENSTPDLSIDEHEHSMHRTVAMKNSAQTLTPDHDYSTNVKAQQNWMNKYPSTYSSSDCVSTSSVLKHNLELQSAQMPAHIQDTNPNASTTIKSPSKTPKKSKIDVFARMRSKSKSSKSSPEQNVVHMADDLQARYVTRLSTIHDSSKSFINLAHNSLHLDNCSKSDRSSFVFNDVQRHDKGTEVALMMEKNAVHRINSALLPPSLRVCDSSARVGSEFSGSECTPLSSAADDDDGDILMENDLEDIPHIPSGQVYSGKEMDYDDTPKMMKNVSLEDWQINGRKLIQNEHSLIGENPKLLPSFEFKPKVELRSNEDFSFPLAKPTLNFESVLEHEHADAVSELDTLLKQKDMDVVKNGDDTDFMVNVLKHEDSSARLRRLSKDLSLNSGPHSPTKSMTSILSGSAAGSMKSPYKLGTVFTNAGNSCAPNQAGHSRSNSQITTLFHSVANYSGINHSTQSSPTKSSRLRRMGKKVSLSNISFKHDEEDGSHGHARGNSIDFSYLHTLQNKHSPSKSVSSISRRNSAILPGDRNLRTVSALFSLASDRDPNKSCNNLDRTLQYVDTGVDQADQGSALSSSSRISDTNYPQAVIGEYDREKWTTIQRLSLNENAADE